MADSRRSNRTVLVLAGAVVLAAGGFVALRNLNIDAFPDTTPVQVQINTVAPALVATEVERLITFPVEMAMGGMPGLANVDIKALNIPTQDEAAKIYCDVTGMAVPDLNWYFSYNLFRLAGITQGIAGRVRDGTAANARALESAARTVPLSRDSWAYAQKAGAV